MLVAKKPPNNLTKMENNYTNITLAVPTTTTISDRPCILAGIVINKAAANGVITIYDGTTSGTAVAIITSPATLLQNQISLNFHDICLKKGLTIVTSAAAQDITIAHRPTT